VASAYDFDQFELNLDKFTLSRGGELVRADALVLRLLEVFLRKPGHVVTKEQLVSDVWDGRAVSDNAITVAVTRLRKTLGRGPRDPTYLQTIPGRPARRTLAARGCTTAVVSSRDAVRRPRAGLGPSHRRTR
jgi:DNA-binding winged helix-turn-helix (wHTH) protein